MTVLVDSWAWIEYFRGTRFGEKARGYIEGEEKVIVSAINVAEVRLFLLRHKRAEEARLIRFLLNTSFPVPVSTEIAVQAAGAKHEKKFGMADAIILATAKMHDAKIVTGDDDFKGQEAAVYIGE
ncbi:type II toxin-antitoxin system VapC family toxin [Candidatus Woesearchaeota archaeon]|nr:type II toxin-antitoxin system VapC family toxin [Candidatus Woesearchaeota archaeon]